MLKLTAVLAIASLTLSASQSAHAQQADPEAEPSQIIIPTQITIPDAASIPGEYRDRSSFEMFHGLRLQEDGTYEWAISVGAMDRRSSGTWAVEDYGIILTTTPRPVAPEFRQDEPDTAEDAPFLQVSWPNGNGIAGINFVLMCEDGKQISHYTQEDGWDLVPEECDVPVSLSLEESIHEIGPAYFNLEEQPDRQPHHLRFTLVPNDFGVEDMTGTVLLPTEEGILMGLRGNFVEMVRVESD